MRISWMVPTLVVWAASVAMIALMASAASFDRHGGMDRAHLERPALEQSASLR